jgi:hypothetical protein
MDRNMKNSFHCYFSTYFDKHNVAFMKADESLVR